MSLHPSPIPVEIAVRTDPGRDPEKQVNEDAAIHVETPLGLLAVVCDGMGGHAGGREASNLAVQTIVELVQGAPPVTKPRDALRVAIEEANRRVWSMSTSEGGYRPGSTVVAVLAHAGGAEIAHVGDSRIYYVHAGAISQITRDHSMVQEMVDRKLLTPEEAAVHPQANKILRALGIAKEVEVDVRSEPIAFVGGDVFILCSDGLSDLVGPPELLDIAGTKPATQAVYQLVEMANARGGHDNITVMCVRMKGTAAPVDAATIVKTMQLTLDATPAMDAASPPAAGPHGTVLALPAQAPPSSGSPLAGATQSQTQTQIGGPGPYAAPPPSVPSGRTQTPRVPKRGSRSMMPWIGAGLGLVALGLMGALFWSSARPRRKVVPIVDAAASPSSSSSASVGEGALEAPAPPIVDTPALPPSEPSACAKARRARESGQADSVVRALEARCRERTAPAPSGEPSATASPPPSSTPTP